MTTTVENLAHVCPRAEDGRADTATCGACGNSWCARCDPCPAALCHTCHGRGYSTAPTLACGHAPTPSGIGTGYAIRDGSRICYPCADDWQREDMRTARRAFAYLSADGRHVTTWTGGRLGKVTRHTANARQVFVRVTDTHGQPWAGIGPAESGTYVSLRRVRGDAR